MGTYDLPDEELVEEESKPVKERILIALRLEGAANKQLQQITGASEGVNSFGAAGWGGPCPPSPGETHTYRWTMYALAQQSELPAGFTAAELQQLAIDAGFASAQVTGTYTRAG